MPLFLIELSLHLQNSAIIGVPGVKMASEEAVEARFLIIPKARANGSGMISRTEKLTI